MDRTERFYKIEMLIRSRGSPSFAELREALEVSPATLKRDLQYLRDRMDAPIEYDPADNGYRFAQDWRGQRHELPGLWFNEGELHALLSMHQMLTSLDENGLLARHLAPMFDKLYRMLGTDEREAAEMTQRIQLIGTARRRAPSEYFETVGSAVVQRRRLQLRYRSRASGASEREVSPQRLVHYRNTWYLDAWCHKSDGLRRFALDAMEAAHWVSREEWHPAQQGRWLDDGRWELQVPYVDATELVMDLLRHAGQVEVVMPAELKTAYVTRLREAAAALVTPAAGA